MALSSTLRGATGVINDVLNSIKDGFKEPFCVEALSCLSMVVRVSPAVRKFIDGDLVTAMFQGGLTTELIDCLKAIVKYSPSIRTLVQIRLRTHITDVLLTQTSALATNAPVLSAASTQSAASHVRSGRAGQKPLFLGGGGASGGVRSAFASSGSSTSSSSKANNIRSQAVSWGANIFFGSGHSTSGGGGAAPLSETHVVESIVSEEEIVLALHVLASFDLLPKHRDVTECSKLLQVTRDGVLRYLDSASQVVRNAAAVTCARVLDKVVEVIPEESEESAVMEQVLRRLLVVGVGDNSEDVRLQVFRSIPHSVDPLISSSSSAHFIVAATNDEAPEVQAAAMAVLSRVAHYDHNGIMPTIHLTLSKLLRDISHTGDLISRRGSMTLLQPMVRGLDVLVVPYVQQLLSPLINLLGDHSAAIVELALATIGDLVLVSPTYISNHLKALIPKIIDAVNDVSSVSKQTAAVITLGKMVSSLCITSDEHFGYPGLFESIVHAIQSQDLTATELRVEATKTAGLLGVVSIEQYSKDLEAYGVAPGTTAHHGTVNNNATNVLNVTNNSDVKDDGGEDEEVGDNAIDDEVSHESVSVDRYYLSVVMKALMKILKNSSLTSHHQTASSVAMRIIRLLGIECLPQIDGIIDGMLSRIYKTAAGHSLQGELISHLVSLVDIVSRNISKHVGSLVKLTCDFFPSHLQQCLDLVEALCHALPSQDFYNVLRDVLPSLLQIMREEVEPSGTPIDPDDTSVSASTPGSLSLSLIHI